MSVGIAPTKDQIDFQFGDAARTLNVTFAKIKALKFWMDQFDSSAIQAFGYSSGEAALLASVASDLEQLRLIYEGSGTLPEAKDFRAFSKQIFGFGVTN